MLFIFNLKENADFLKHLFRKKSKLLRLVLETIKITKSVGSTICAKIFSNLFFQQYNEILISANLEKKMIFHNERFSQVNTDGIDQYPKEIYRTMLSHVLNLCVTYENIQEVYDKNSQISFDDCIFYT
jgi:hypothetical protein